MNNTAYEATNSDEQLIAEMKAAAEKATSGEWWSDVVECDGTYGNGDECAEGFHSYAVYDSNNQTLLDMTNSTAACIQVDCDDESHYAWDEVAERNAEYIVLARPENVLKLIAALEQAQRNAMRYQFIRDKDAFGDEKEPGLIGWDGLVELDANEFDAAIDARMAHPSVAYAPAPNGMMQLSNELAEMKRKCVELENQKFDTAKLINKFYTRYPLESFKSDPERAETLGYYMAGAEVQHFGDFVVYEMPEDDEGSE